MRSYYAHPVTRFKSSEKRFPVLPKNHGEHHTTTVVVLDVAWLLARLTPLTPLSLIATTNYGAGDLTLAVRVRVLLLTTFATPPRCCRSLPSIWGEVTPAPTSMSVAKWDATGAI